jgi:spermidine synthase
VFIASFIILLPLCALLGFLFSLGSKIYGAKEDVAGLKAGSVYALESLGGAAGGALAGFLLIRFFTALEIMAILGLLNIAAAFFLKAPVEINKMRSRFSIFSSCLFIAFILFWLSGGLSYLQRFSLDKQWQGRGFISSENSIYGNLVITKNQSQHSLFYNGTHLYTMPNQQAIEEAVNFALLEHPSPGNVLLIGGGAGGLLEEILKHPVNSVDYLELDPAIIRITEKYLPDDKTAILRDRRVNIRNIDGRFFVKKSPKKYDCLVLYLGDPYTSQLNRYYTVEFFRQVKSALNESGVFSFALISSENYMNLELRNFLRSIYAGLKDVFADVKVIPGETAYFLACDKPGVLTYDYNILIERAKARLLDLKYVRDYYLFSKMSPKEISFMENSLRLDSSVRKNYDFSPVSYYYGMTFWASRFRDSLLNKIFSAVNKNTVWSVILIFSAIILLSGLLRKKDIKEARRKAVLLTVSVAGFTQISAQMVILLCFQIIYGYLFYKLGILIAFFMAGLFLGGFMVTRIIWRLKDHFRFFRKLQFLICLYIIVLPVCMWYLNAQNSPVVYWFGSNVVFAVLSFLPGAISGASFALANEIYLSGPSKTGQAAGVNYSMDLLGSALGALFTALFLIPLLDIFQACWSLAIINFAVLIRLILTPSKITSLE